MKERNCNEKAENRNERSQKNQKSQKSQKSERNSDCHKQSDENRY